MIAAYNSYDDAALVHLLSTGDDLAFTEIYNRYWQKLVYVAGVKCRDLGIAEEIVQDIFLDLWNRRASLSITGTLEGYLAVAVKYRVINAQARMKRALGYQQSLAGKFTPTEQTTEKQLAFHELQSQLERYVKNLPEKCRITYQLSREAGFSQREIASQLKITEKAVEANLSRALRSLRMSLKNYLSVFITILF